MRFLIAEFPDDAMHHRLIRHKTALTRSLALAALLLFSAAQVHEAAHSHAAQDTGSHCLLCKHATDAAAVVTKAPVVLHRLFEAPAAEDPRAALAILPSHLFARAPPTLS